MASSDAWERLTFAWLPPGESCWQSKALAFSSTALPEIGVRKHITPFSFLHISGILYLPNSSTQVLGETALGSRKRLSPRFPVPQLLVALGKTFFKASMVCTENMLLALPASRPCSVTPTESTIFTTCSQTQVTSSISLPSHSLTPMNSVTYEALLHPEKTASWFQAEHKNPSLAQNEKRGHFSHHTKTRSFAHNLHNCSLCPFLPTQLTSLF